MQSVEDSDIADVAAVHGLSGLRTSLRPVLPGDVEFLYHLSCSDETGFRTRYHGSIPSIERFARDLWLDLAAQFIVCRSSGMEPVGWISSYSWDVRNRTVHLSLVVTPHEWMSGVAIEAVHVMLRHLFGVYNVRKVYAEMPSYTMKTVEKGIGRLFSLEAVLEGGHYWGGHYWDLGVLAVHRSAWEQIAPGFDRLVYGIKGLSGI